MTKTNIGKRTQQKRWWKQIDPLFWPYAVLGLATIFVSLKFCVYWYRLSSIIPESSYQAVFLSNGQVYFGHLDFVNRSYLELTDVYYLQESSNAITGQTETEDDNADSSQLAVVRLGNEVHQPFNHMIVNRDHVLFWETLQANSRIIEAINTEKSQ